MCRASRDHVNKALDRYRKDADVAISSIVKSEDIAKKSEWMIFPEDIDNENDDGNASILTGSVKEDDNDKLSLLSSKLEERIASNAEVLESDGFVLEKLLEPFQFVRGLPGCDDTYLQRRWMYQ